MVFERVCVPWSPLCACLLTSARPSSVCTPCMLLASVCRQKATSGGTCMDAYGEGGMPEQRSTRVESSHQRHTLHFPWSCLMQQDGVRAIALPTADAAVTTRSSSVRCDGRAADCKCTERGGAACQCSRNPGQPSAGKTTIRCMPCRCQVVQQADDFSSHANTSHRASPEPSAPPVEPSVAHPLTRSPHLAIGAVAALHCTDPNLVPPTAAPTVTNYLSTAPCSPPLPAAAPGGCQQDETGRGRAGGV